jgi:1-acyl-sn-glycerol-3-phosphate acyltransferase
MSPPDRSIRHILKTYAWLFGRSCIVTGKDTLPPGRKIIAMNHTEGCDPLHLPLILNEPLHFLLQDGLFTIPVIGRLLKQAGQIPVYRGTVRAKEALAQACDLLRQGETVVVFPEGRQPPAGQRIRAKTGTVRMSLETGAPIIPLGLYAEPQNLIDIQVKWRGTRRCGLWQLTGRSYMRFGAAWRPVLHPAREDQPQIDALTGQLMDRIYHLVSEIQEEIQCESPSSLSPIPQW